MTPEHERCLRFLSSAASYGLGEGRVERIETHVSQVFLVDGHVYKLKKPIRNGDFDFSAVAARRSNAQAEVALNRRLAPQVYLGVVPVTESASGELALAGPGRPVDWLVHMRRLPADRQLDALIGQGGPTRAEAAALAEVLCRFHLGLAPERPPVSVFTAHLRGELELSLALLREPRFALPSAVLAAATRLLPAFLDQEAAWFRRRIDIGRVVEGHGDLRPEHVFLLESPVIIDCLEFSRRLRVVDVLDELGFLALECQRLGAAWVGEVLLSAWYRCSGEQPAPKALAFYQAFRACIRARLAIAHLDDVHVAEPGKWQARARQYLALLASRLQVLAPGGSDENSESS